MLQKLLLPLIYLIVRAASESLGPPAGSVGFIDWRYPNEIVKPRPTCATNGVFPHPKDCTWYYRCHDRLNIGYYTITFYECEKGTVFSNELDQCVFPFNAPPPCGTKPTSPQPSPQPFPQPPPQITPKPPSPQPQPTQPSPQPPPPAPPACYIQYYNCKDAQMCPGGDQSKRFTFALCAAKNYCTNSDSSVYSNDPACGTGTYFNPNEKSCYVPPKSQDLCPDYTWIAPSQDEGSVPTTTTSRPTTTSSTITLPTNENIECSETNLIPDSKGIRKREECTTYYLCDASGKLTSMDDMCQTYYQCFRDETWDIITMGCPNQNELYSYSQKKCVSPPTENLCGTNGESTSPQPTPQPQPQPPPPAPPACYTQYYNCKDAQMCPGGDQSKRFIFTLCAAKNYCNNSDSSVYSNEPTCERGSYFNPKEKSCYLPPQSHDLCPGYTWVAPSLDEGSVSTTTTTSRPTSTPSKITLPINEKIDCSEENLIPDSKGIKNREDCTTYFMCDTSGKPTSIDAMCQTYYQCVKKDTWTVLTMSCQNKNELYSYNQKRCMSPPTENLCEF